MSPVPLARSSRRPPGGSAAARTTARRQARSRPKRHQRVHQLVAPGDAVEHRPHVGRRAGRASAVTAAFQRDSMAGADCTRGGRPRATRGGRAAGRIIARRRGGVESRRLPSPNGGSIHGAPAVSLSRPRTGDRGVLRRRCAPSRSWRSTSRPTASTTTRRRSASSRSPRRPRRRFSTRWPRPEVLDGLAAVLADAAVRKIVHGGDYDVRLLKRERGGAGAQPLRHDDRRAAHRARALRPGGAARGALRRGARQALPAGRLVAAAARPRAAGLRGRGHRAPARPVRPPRGGALRAGAAGVGRGGIPAARADRARRAEEALVPGPQGGGAPRAAPARPAPGPARAARRAGARVGPPALHGSREPDADRLGAGAAGEPPRAGRRRPGPAARCSNASRTACSRRSSAPQPCRSGSARGRSRRGARAQRVRGEPAGAPAGPCARRRRGASAWRPGCSSTARRWSGSPARGRAARGPAEDLADRGARRALPARRCWASGAAAQLPRELLEDLARRSRSSPRRPRAPAGGSATARSARRRG